MFIKFMAGPGGIFVDDDEDEVEVEEDDDDVEEEDVESASSVLTFVGVREEVGGAGAPPLKALDTWSMMSPTKPDTMVDKLGTCREESTINVS